MLQIGDVYKQWPLSLRIAVSAVIFTIAILVRFLILPLGEGLPFITLFSAAVISFYFCGIWPSAPFLFISTVVADSIFNIPYWAFPRRVEEWIAMFVFLISATLTGWVVKRLQISSEKLEERTKALELSEERYKKVVEDQTELICRFTMAGTILYVNDAYCRFFGKSRESLIGDTWHPVALDEDIPLINERLSTLTTANPLVLIENRVIAGDGTTRWCQFINQAFFDREGCIQEMLSVGRDITDRKVLEEKLAESSREIEDLYDHAPCAYHSVDSDGVYVRVNATELKWLGYSREELIGKKKVSDFYTADSKEKFQKLFPEFLQKGHFDSAEYDVICRDGVIRHVSLSATAIRDNEGKFLMSRAVMYDITDLKKLQDKLVRVSDEQQAMLDNDLVGIMKIHDRHILWKNRAMDRIFGYQQDELIGQSTRILYPNEEAYQTLGNTAYPILHEHKSYRTQLEWVSKDGKPIWVDLSGVLLSINGTESLWMVLDITILKEQQELITRMAYHDILTGLPNRRLVTDRLNQAVAQAVRANRMLAVCYLDLDGFKPINDTYGHEAGDLLLKEMATRMQAAVRANDTVGRFGGDEFILLLTDLETEEEYQVVVNRLRRAIEQPISINDSIQVKVGASIGITLFPSDTDNPDMLLRHADQAMYQAKIAGRNRVCIY